MLLEKTLESPLDSKEIKPVNPRRSTLNIHGKDWCWGPNNLATWYEELTHWKRPWCWARLKAEGEGGGRGWDGWMALPDSMDMNLSKVQVMVEDRGVWCAAVCGATKSWTGFSNWTTTTKVMIIMAICGHFTCHSLCFIPTLGASLSPFPVLSHFPISWTFRYPGAQSLHIQSSLSIHGPQVSSLTSWF